MGNADSKSARPSAFLIPRYRGFVVGRRFAVVRVVVVVFRFAVERFRAVRLVVGAFLAVLVALVADRFVVTRCRGVFGAASAIDVSANAAKIVTSSILIVLPTMLSLPRVR